MPKLLMLLIVFSLSVYGEQYCLITLKNGQNNSGYIVSIYSDKISIKGFINSRAFDLMCDDIDSLTINKEVLTAPIKGEDILAFIKNLGKSKQPLTLSGNNQVSSGNNSKPIETISKSDIYNPCTDSLFLKLKAKPLDKLSEREYKYFLKKDDECVDFSKTAKPADNTPSKLLFESDTKANYSKPLSTSNVDNSIVDCQQSQSMGYNQAIYSHSSGGWFAGGVACGTLLGIIGAGVITVAAANSDPMPYNIPKNVNRDCYMQGYYEKAKSKNKWSAFGGGLVGTVVIVIVFISLSN